MQCNLMSETLVEVLYGEADAEARRRLEEHVAACAACRGEWEGLQKTRRDLQAWKLPELRRPRRPALPAPRWFRLAAAAALLLATGAALGLARVELRYDSAGARLSFGRPPAAGPDALQREREARYEQRIQALEAALQRVSAAPAVAAGAPTFEDLQRLVRESETRQAERLRASLADYGEQAEVQRRLDQARFTASLAYLDGRTGQHMARATELMGYMLDASEKR